MRWHLGFLGRIYIVLRLTLNVSLWPSTRRATGVAEHLHLFCSCAAYTHHTTWTSEVWLENCQCSFFFPLSVADVWLWLLKEISDISHYFPTFMREDNQHIFAVGFLVINSFHRPTFDILMRPQYHYLWRVIIGSAAGFPSFQLFNLIRLCFFFYLKRPQLCATYDWPSHDGVLPLTLTHTLTRGNFTDRPRHHFYRHIGIMWPLWPFTLCVIRTVCTAD